MVRIEASSSANDAIVPKADQTKARRRNYSAAAADLGNCGNVCSASSSANAIMSADGG
jgi:hypothetical protein